MASCKSLVSSATTDDRNAVPGPILRDLAGPFLGPVGRLVVSMVGTTGLRPSLRRRSTARLCLFSTPTRTPTHPR